MKRAEYYYNEHDENQVKKILKAKKKRRLKRRIKVLLLLMFLALIGFYFMSDYSKVQSIEIVGTNEVDKETILNQISVNKNTYYLFVNKKKVAEEVKNVGMIKKASVACDLLGHMTIEIEEAEKVAYCEIGEKIYVIDEIGGVFETDDKEFIKTLQSCPRLSQFKDVKFLKEFAKAYVEIPELIKNQTSDIIYSPKKADESRLEFVMDNGKKLYLRVEEMVEQLKNFDYEANMTMYSDRCVFSFEGKNMYMRKCK